MRQGFLVLLVAALPLQAGAFPIAQMDLFGQGALPLGLEPGNANDGYGLVESEVSLSALPGSEVTITFDIAPSFLEVVFSLNFELFTEITITDIDPVADFSGALGPAFTLTPLAPLSATLDAIVDFSSFDPADPFATIPVSSTTISNSIKETLNVDVNGNGELDFIEFTIGDFLFVDEDAISFDFINPDNPDEGLIVTSASLSLSGQVADVSTDPPFTIAMSTNRPPVNVAEPAIAALFGAGLAGLVIARRRRGGLIQASAAPPPTSGRG